MKKNMASSVGVPKGKSERSEEERWKIESDVKTLKEAEMIRMDTGRMKKAMSMMDEEMQAMMKAKGMKE